MPLDFEQVRMLPLLGISVVSFLLSFFGSSIGLVGGQFRLPLLLLYFPLDPVRAASTSLAISAAGAFSGSLRHWREGHVNLRLFLAIGLPSGIAALVCMYWISGASADWVVWIIGGVLAISGLNLVFGKEPVPAGNPREMRINLLKEVGLGVGLGAISGIVGLMMGSLRLPAMIRFLGVTPQVAVGTNLAIGCLTGVLGAVGAIAAGNIDYVTLIVIVPVTMIGANLGARLTKKYNSRKLRLTIGWTVAILGLMMAFSWVAG